MTKKRYRKAGFNSKKEATKAYNEAYDKASNNIIVNKKQPFVDYFDEWIKNKQRRYCYSINFKPIL
ncbi:hypothetical protein HIR68_01980 [Staphylococcus coagulans]|nr:Arm DNA-binding domain-containing protein [Staphylococcus coagulans]MBT2830006.1 hypothetical protein [Staphylococcus coagulans]MBT2859149.1 hypothetical protein [Staphylococcus coagulans]MBU3873446.1 Arm DNA-binding domain-containing protein [Staphylococcus coagulans]UNB49702.1 Arm DNA-binding domain-containing protein [Staphylococcus coagulans]